MDGFGAEAGKDHELEDIDIEIYNNGIMVTKIVRNIDLTTISRQMKIEVLCHRDVPNGMRQTPDDCDLLYMDDNTREVIPDNINLLKYEENLACENSKLQVVKPRIQDSPTQPKMCFNELSVKKRYA